MLSAMFTHVESTKFGAFAGDAGAQALWNSVGQSDDDLEEACMQIGIDQPDELAKMHWNWTAAQSSSDTAP